MGLFRTYFTQENTLIKNSTINTANNPVTELFYGGDKGISRYIFKFDHTEIENKLTENSVESNQNVKHVLKMYNCGSFDINLNEAQSVNGRERASSFDLVLFKIPSGQTWDQGRGYDFVYKNQTSSSNSTYINEPSNWYSRTQLSTWNESGVYSGATSDMFIPLKTVHFGKGNENLELDITDVVTNLLSGNTTNDGFGLAFAPAYEELSTPQYYTTAFFTSKTNTYFEPFIETTFEQVINDDRDNFILGKVNKLYLYTNINKSPIDLDSLPTSVDIVDQEGDVYTTLTNIVKEGKGVYSVSLTLPFSYQKNVMLEDVWKGLVYNGVSLPEVTMEFVTVTPGLYFNIGNKSYETEDYKINFSGLRVGETILDNEKRKVIVEVRPFYTTDKVIVEDIFYRIYVKQGKNQIDIVPKSKMHKAFKQNYFILDSSWMIEHEYFLEISVLSNGLMKNVEEISFSVKEVGFNN